MRLNKRLRGRQHRKRRLIVAGFVCLSFVGAIFYYDFLTYLNLENFRNHKEMFLNLAEQKPLFFMLTLFISYTCMSIISPPGVLFFTLAAGFLFGFWKAVLLVSLSLTLGCLVAFLFCRIVFRRFIKKRISTQLKYILEEIDSDASYYLFAMRMIPFLPFIVPNFLMSLTSIKTKRYVIISYLGSLPYAVLSANAGTQLSKVQGLRDLFSIKILLSLLLIGLFPLIIKKVFQLIEKIKKQGMHSAQTAS